MIMYYFCTILLLLQFPQFQQFEPDNSQLLAAVHIFGHNIGTLLLADEHGKQSKLHSGKRNRKAKVFPSEQLEKPETTITARVETYLQDFDEFMDMAKAVGRIRRPKATLQRAKQAASAEKIRAFLAYRRKTDFDQIVNGLQSILGQKHAERTEGKAGTNVVDKLTQGVRALHSKIAAFIGQIRLELAFGDQRWRQEWHQLDEELDEIKAEMASNLGEIIRAQVDRKSVKNKEKETANNFADKKQRGEISAQLENKWHNLYVLSRASRKVLKYLKIFFIDEKGGGSKEEQLERENFNNRAYVYKLVELTILPILHQIGGSSRYAGIPEMVSVEPQKLSDWFSYEQETQTKLRANCKLIKQKQKRAGVVGRFMKRIKAKFKNTFYYMDDNKYADADDGETLVALLESRIMFAATKVLSMFESARTLLGTFKVVEENGR